MVSPIERLARRLAGLESQVRGLSRTPQLAYSSIEDGALEEYDGAGNLVSVIGKQFDGTHGLLVVSGPVPPRPAAPDAEGGPGLAVIGWGGVFARADGTADVSIPAPADWSRTEIHLSQTKGFTAGLDTLVDTLESPRGGQRTFMRPAGTWYAVLVSRATSGKASAQSTEVAILVDAPTAGGGNVDELAEELEQSRLEQAQLASKLDTARGELDMLVGALPLPAAYARHLAAYTAAVMELDVSRLRVSDASLGTAVAEKLLAEVVNGRRVIGASVETNEAPEVGLKLNDDGLTAHGQAGVTRGDAVDLYKVRAVVDNRVNQWGDGDAETLPGFWLESEPADASGSPPLFASGLTLTETDSNGIRMRSAMETPDSPYGEVVASPDGVSLNSYGPAAPGSTSRPDLSVIGVYDDSFNIGTSDGGYGYDAQVQHLGDGVLRLNGVNGVLLNGRPALPAVVGGMPAGGVPKQIIGEGSATTTASGVFTVTYADLGFSTKAAIILVTPTSGTAGYPVVNGGRLYKDRAEMVIPSAPNTRITYSYIAIGY